jgi:hypothetical protein
VLSDTRNDYARIKTELENIIKEQTFIFEQLKKIKQLLDDHKIEEVPKFISNLGFNPFDPKDSKIQSINQRYQFLAYLSKDMFECPCCHGTGRHPPQKHKGKAEEYGRDCSTCEGRGNLKDWIEPHHF